MVQLRYFFLSIYIFIIIVILRMAKCTEQPSTVWFCALQVFYVVLYGVLIMILVNRKKLLADRRFSAFEVSINFFLLNILLSASMIWCAQLLEGQKAFDNLTSLFDAMYFSVITFVTVGYGDIKPITPLAKTICMEAAVSNLLILVVFMNYFIAKASIKKNYIMDCVLHIVFMFEHMTNRIQISDKSLKGIQKTWPEWGNELIRILRENLEENPDRVEMLKQRIDVAKDQNSKKTLRESAIDLTGIYINDTEHFLLEGLYDDMNEFVISNYLETYKKDNADVLSSGQMDIRLRRSTIAPSIGIEFFVIDDEHFQDAFEKERVNEIVYIRGRCREETIYCILNELWRLGELRPIFVVRNEQSWHKLHAMPSENNIYIPWFYADEIVAIEHNTNIFVLDEDTPAYKRNVINLRPRTLATISRCLQDAGLDSFKAHDLLEDTHDKLARNYEISVYNRRGVHNVTAGKDELRMAEEFRKNAEYLAPHYPSTARIYYSLFDTYKRESERERQLAENGWY